jgi:Rrf2 family transcriptional regulator, iron-sulfur cluster assembly transcription factor
MRFTAQEEYGLRCLVQMARHEGEGGMAIPEIAKQEGITVAYAGKLMRVLREAGLLESTRGMKGGYRLAKPAEQISLSEILVSLGGEFYPKDHCNRYPGNEHVCVHNSDCSIRSAWMNLDVLLESILSRVMLKDLVRSERDMAAWMRGNAEALVPQKVLREFGL